MHVRHVYDVMCVFFFFQAEDGIRDLTVTGVQTCALPIFTVREAPQVARQRRWPAGCVTPRSDLIPVDRSASPRPTAASSDSNQPTAASALAAPYRFHGPWTTLAR